MTPEPIGSSLGVAGAAWPIALAMAVVVVENQRWRRRRRMLNRALHEVRRPLQVLALQKVPGAALDPDPLKLALIALQDLDGVVNGQAPHQEPRRVEARMLALSAAERWRARAAAAGRPVVVRWRCGDVVTTVDADRIAQALDNLIANAVEHGDGPIAIEGLVRGGRLELEVRVGSSRSDSRRPVRRGDPRHGHGLRVARALARENGGSLRVRFGGRNAVAALTLPLA